MFVVNGVNRTWPGQPNSVANDPKTTSTAHPTLDALYAGLVPVKELILAANIRCRLLTFVDSLCLQGGSPVAAHYALMNGPAWSEQKCSHLDRLLFRAAIGTVLQGGEQSAFISLIACSKP
jgi:hypothetical protein